MKMLVGTNRFKNLVLVVAVLAWNSASNASPIVEIINDATHGYYNSSIGNTLEGVSSHFPVAPADPMFNPAGDPGITPGTHPAGFIALDGFFTGVLGGNWSGPGPIPLTWTLEDETAVIYEFASAYAGVNVSIAVDNGAYVYVDGAYVGGGRDPGGAGPGDVSVNIGSVVAGTLLGIIYEDQGVANARRISVTGCAVPEPSQILFGVLALVGIVGWKKKRSFWGN